MTRATVACTLACTLAYAVALSIAAGETLAGTPDQPASGRRDWSFTVLLDGKVIGSHRFVLETDDRVETGSVIVTSDARFDVKVPGLTVYRYRHHAREQWSGDCLASIYARTEEDGQRTQLDGRQSADGFAVEVSSARDGASRKASLVNTSCLMSFAYWNPALKTQRQLLDPASGRVVAVVVMPLRTATIEYRGHAVTVDGLRITGLEHPIDVWYAGNLWIGLDAVVGRGRHLSYRLQ